MATDAFCPSCGSPAQAGARFCANCGTALHPASASRPEPSPHGPPSQWSSPDARQGQPGVGGATRQGFGWALGCLILAIVVIVGVLGLLWVGLTAATPSEESPGDTAAAPSSDGALLSATLQGTGDHTGPPFTLSGGDYVLTWSATSTGDASSAWPFAAFVEDANGVADSSSVDTDIPGGQTRSGTEYLYGLAAGQHHFKIITVDTTWQVSIAPR